MTGRPLTEKIEHIKSFLAKSHITYRQSIVKLYLQTEKGKKSALELLSSKQIHYYQVREELKNI